MKLFLPLIAATTSLAAATACAATGEEIYRAKCSTCHDAGMASAPRIGDKAEWARRNRQGTQALYRAALQGKPNTAMMAKGGFAELADAEIIAVVDYLLAQAGQARRSPASAAGNSGVPAAQTRAADATRAGAAAKIDDDTLVANIKTVLAKTKGIVARDIKLEAADGIVTLRGVVDNADQIKLAEAVAAGTKGVQRVDNKLIPKNMFEWD